MTVRKSAAIAAILLAIPASAARADGVPEVIAPPPHAPHALIVVQSSDAFSPSRHTAYGRYAASSGDVDPGTVTIAPEFLWLPDVIVDINRRDRRWPQARRPVR